MNGEPGELTVPHFWALDRPDNIPVPPPGWVLSPVGNINGEPFAIATAPHLHDIAVVAGGLSAAQTAGFAESGWSRFSRTDATEIWWRDLRPPTPSPANHPAMTPAGSPAVRVPSMGMSL